MEITGTIEHIIYYNSENGYTVLSLETEDGFISCTGTSYGPSVGETVILDGDINYHSKYGEQFEFVSIQSTMPHTKSGILIYLKSGNLPFIGPKTAERIVETFGEETPQILEERPEELGKIPGISKKRLEKIVDALEKGKESRKVILSLADLGIYGADAYKIYDAYGEDSYFRVKADPYEMARRIRGFGFLKSDAVARKIGIAPNDIRRLKAAIIYVLQEAQLSGHVFLEESQVFFQVKKLMEPKQEDFPLALTELNIEGDITRKVDEQGAKVYLTGLFIVENAAAQMTVNLIQNTSIQREGAEEAIEDFFQKTELDYDREQKEAISMALLHSISIITGGPGTGKTTIISAILEIAEGLGWKVKLAAPTGRAAKRMEETSGGDAYTLHRLLQMRPSGEDEFDLVTDEVDADLIIVDEASMVDVVLYANLLHALSGQTALVLVGDQDQLPSVGCGNVLKDLLQVKEIPHVYLQKIHRTEDTSHIALASRDIRKGVVPGFNEKNSDVFFMEEKDEETFVQNLLHLVEERLPNYFGFSPITDIQILSPTKKGGLGTDNLNRLLQERINKEETLHLTYKNQKFKLGDKVMQISNNYEKEIRYKTVKREGDKGIFNGDIGIVTHVDMEAEMLEVLFSDDYYVEYSIEELDQLKLAYAITVHKSQGSEFPGVIFIAWKSNYLLNNRNLLYTGVSRARELLILMGNPKTFNQMLKNTHVQKRNTTLQEKIEERIGFEQEMLHM
ncbi:MAG: ATP-dependent RecD-like DNA helicase [Tissierellia bacterium]|nr:ATP-dependent RecD-like DNA helicase [Tissierellia bacterium]